MEIPQKANLIRMEGGGGTAVVGISNVHRLNDVWLEDRLIVDDVEDADATQNLFRLIPQRHDAQGHL